MFINDVASRELVLRDPSGDGNVKGALNSQMH